MKHLEYQLIKHKYNTDVAFDVRKAVYIQKGRWKLRGFWVNISNPGRIFHILPDTIVIQPEQKQNWKLYGHEA